MNPSRHQFIHHDSFQPFPIEDNSVDLVITSPPYPMVEMWDWIFSTYDTSIIGNLAKEQTRVAFEKMHVLLDNCWRESFRVLKSGGFACINIGDATRTINGHFQLYSNHSRILIACSAIGFDVLPGIIWRKPTNAPNKFMGSGMLPAGAYVTMEHEHILILRKHGKRQFSKEEKVIRSASALFWEERNTFFCDEWKDVSGTRQKMHIDSMRKRSAAFPIDVPLRVIQMYSQAGDLVLDPFSGTGTTALAAITTGRNSINIDADERLLEASAKLPTMHKTKSELNGLLKARLSRHMDYVSSKDMLFFRYKNGPLGIPVKTLQEKQLMINLIQSITKKENETVVNYRKFKSAELNELIKPPSLTQSED